MSRDAILAKCRMLLEDDRARGRLRSLSSYQRMFRGFEDVVAEEYARVAAASPSPDDQSARDRGPARLAGAATEAAGAAPPATAPPGIPQDARTESPSASAPRPTPTAAPPRPPTPAEALVARVAGRTPTSYTDLGEIARGGMGAILRVRDEVLERELAMKVILGSSSGDGDAAGQVRDRFVAEAKVTAHLDHPGVVPIHELGLDANGHLYFTMKLVGGRTLSDVFGMVRTGRDGWTLTRAVGLLVRVCETLAFAHSRGVVHRDVKPANVMVGDFGEVYVMDWGLAKSVVGADAAEAGDARGIVDPGPREVAASAAPTGAPAPARTGPRPPEPTTPRTGTNLTLDGTVLGTPGYMAPEQVSAALGTVDARSDVFAVGSILYELLAGTTPYAAPNGELDPRTVLLDLFRGPPAPLAERAPDAPDELVSITEKAMSRDQSARYADASELARDLRDWLDGRAVRAHRTGPVVELVKWVRRNRALATAIGAAVALLVVGLSTNLVLLRDARRETERARRQAYRANMSSASAALRDHQATAAASRLEAAAAAAPPGWEHDVLSVRIDETSGQIEASAARPLPDGSLALILEDGRALRRRPGVPDEVLVDPRPARVVRLSPDGRFALVQEEGVSATNVLRVLRTSDGAERARLPILAESALSACFHAERPWIYWSGTDECLHVTDLDTGAECAPPASVRIWRIAAPPSGSTERPDGLVFATRHDASIEVRDGSTLALRATLSGHTETASLAYCRIRERAYTASIDDTVCAWDLTAPEAPLWRSSGPRLKDPIAVSVSSDGASLRVAPADGTLVLLDAATGAETHVLHGPVRGTLRRNLGDESDLTQSADGTTLYSPQQRGRVAVWDASHSEDPRVLRGHRSFVYDLEFSPDGTRVVSAGWDAYVGHPGSTRIWDVASGAEIARFGSDSEWTMSVVWPDGEDAFLATTNHLSGRTRLLRIDGSTGAETELVGDGRQVAVSPSGRRAVVALPRIRNESERVLYQLIDVATGKVLAEGPEGVQSQLGATYCGTRFIAIDPNGNGTGAHVYDAETLRLLRVLEGHTSTIWFAAESPDGRLLFTGAADGCVRVWDTATWDLLHVLPGHGAAAFCARPSGDGTRLAVGGHDGQVRIWDTATWEEITAFHGHANYVKDVEFAPDGVTLASASGDGTIRIWSPEPVALRAAAIRARNALVATWTPRVRSLLGDPRAAGFEAAAASAARSIRDDRSLPQRERDVALQVLLAEACRARTGR